MKKFPILIGLSLVLAACGPSGSLDFMEVSTLDFESEPAGSVTVRGNSYPITKRTGRDEDTGEIFVVEYSTKVDGRRVTCVGDVAGCPAAIERELDMDRDKGDY